MSNKLLQEAILAQLKFDLASLLKKENPSESYLRSMMKDLEDTYNHSKRMHADIITNEFPTPDMTQYKMSDTYNEIRELYHNLWSKLDDLLPRRPTPSLEETLNQTLNFGNLGQPECGTTGLKLPRLNLPQFSGDYDEWKNFYNLFSCAIHEDKKLKPVQKLQYLQSNVSGPPKDLIKHYPLEDRNYTLALQALKDEYDHKRILANRQLSILFNQEVLRTENATGIKKILATTTQSLVSLENLGLNTENWDCILIYLLQSKLPRNVVVTWEEKLGSSKEIPTFAEFKEFLEGRFRSLEMMELSASNFSEQKRSPKTLYTNSKQKGSTIKCTLCKNAHYLSRCFKFLKFNDKAKIEFITKHKLCQNCFSEYHNESDCASKRNCNSCNQRHHTLIHNHFSTPPHENSNTPRAPVSNGELGHSSNSKNIVKRNYHISANKNKITLLGTAQLKIFNEKGHHITIRALIDPCSDESYVTDSTLSLIALTKYYSPTSISVIGDQSAGTCTHRSDFLIGSLYNNFKSYMSAIVVKTITSNLPSHIVPQEDLTYLDGLYLADPSFDHPGKIHMLIGADIASDIEIGGFKKFKRTSARESKLGWIVRGVIESETHHPRPGISFLTSSMHSDQINFDLEQFWKIEEISTGIPPHPDDELCESLFLSSVVKYDDGRFCVKLPFKNGVSPVLGSSKEIALRRFLNIEKKLERNPELKIEYHNTMKEYLASGHMVLKDTEIDYQGKEYTIPHHAVFKSSSTTTKVRVVYDASCKTSDGSSLNDHLLTGPKLQVDICDILFQWRRYKFVVTADIARMYRQFWVSKDHHPYQQILWRFSSNEPVREYFLTTITFGTSPAPFLAMRLLLHLSNSDLAKELPLAAEALSTEFYVDDLLSGAFEENIAIQKQIEIRRLLHSAGLHIRKWSSNNSNILQDIPQEDLELTNTELLFDEDDFRKTLGILWCPETDCFSFTNTEDSEIGLLTKRKVLSLISKLFDPLGFISPCIIIAKNIMKSIWKSKCDWDEEIDTEIKNHFRMFLNQLPNLKKLRIPRWIGTLDDSSKIQVFGFCDASTMGYGACIYIRYPNENRFSLLSSKTKVAPSQYLSIARLELCGAVLLTDLLQWAQKLFRQEVSFEAFCDSKIVLSWLNSHPTKWKVFVANRTTHILDFLPSNHWHYIESKNNPADHASRGLYPNDLVNNDLWWSGPTLESLSLTSNELPTENQLKEIESERKATNSCLMVLRESNYLLERYSSHYKLITIVDICCKFITKYLKPFSQTVERIPLIIDRLRSAESVIMRSLQLIFFKSEIEDLNNKKPLDRKSHLLSLNPFLDANGVLRVGGRIDNSELLTFDEKHPIIIPSKHRITLNIIADAHIKTIHGTVKETCAYIRRKYHVIRLTDRVKLFIHHCTPCFRFLCKKREELMGILPYPRVNVARPFLHTGVDFAGPVKVKVWKGRTKSFYKSYIAIFVCMATKAIHIELVTDLTSEGFLAAFRRLSSRRGRVHEMFSDQGTNFVGAKKVLSDECIRAQATWNDELKPVLADLGTVWHLNPPASPNFGGLWEAGVKSVKTHMYKILKDMFFTFEELNTLLVQIEGSLNSRPLCPFSNNAEDYNFLTPSHFLIGEAIIAPPEPSLEFKKISSLKRWQLIQNLNQQFWKLWSRDYLQHLQRRSKWLTTNSRQIQVNDLVLLCDERYPPMMWSRARVIETFPGQDNIVRVVTLKKPDGSISKRSISKIRLLPLNDDLEN